MEFGAHRQSDIEEMSNESTRQHHILPSEIVFFADIHVLVCAAQQSVRDKSSERQPKGKDIGDLLGYMLPRPGLVGSHSSFSGSDAWGPSVSDPNLSQESPSLPISQNTEAGSSRRSAALFKHPSVSTVPLVRTVSFGAKAAIDFAGVEYVHEGHGWSALEAHIQPQAALLASQRRKSVRLDDAPICCPQLMISLHQLVFPRLV